MQLHCSANALTTSRKHTQPNNTKRTRQRQALVGTDLAADLRKVVGADDAVAAGVDEVVRRRQHVGQPRGALFCFFVVVVAGSRIYREWGGC